MYNVYLIKFIIVLNHFDYEIHGNALFDIFPWSTVVCKHNVPTINTLQPCKPTGLGHDVIFHYVFCIWNGIVTIIKVTKLTTTNNLSKPTDMFITWIDNLSSSKMSCQMSCFTHSQFWRLSVRSYSYSESYIVVITQRLLWLKRRLWRTIFTTELSAYQTGKIALDRSKHIN